MRTQSSNKVAQLSDSQAGERRRFIEALYREFHGDLCRFLYRLNIEEGRVDTLAHDVYLRILRMETLQKIEASPKSYLFKIAINLVRDQARRESRHKEYEMKQKLMDDNAVMVSTPETEAQGEEIVKILHQAMDELSQQHREILMLHRFKHLTCRDIASKMNMSQRTVERYLSYAITFCQEKLKGLDDE